MSPTPGPSGPLASVLVLSPYYPPVLGGAETAAAQFAEYFAAEGRRVTVVTRRTPSASHDVITDTGIVIRRVGVSGPRTGPAKWLALPAVLTTLLRHRRTYDVVLCVDYRAFGIAAVLARLWTGHPVIFQAATDGVISLRAVQRWGHRCRGMAGAAIRPLLAMIIRLTSAPYRAADAYLCISHEIEAETRAAGVPEPRVHHVPNPVDTVRFAPATHAQRLALRTAVGISSDAVVAVQVARLSREKGTLDAVAAWARPATSDVELLFVGPDMVGHPWNVGDEARARAAAMGASSHIRFVGGVPADDVVQWLQLADMALQPSHFEAFGTAAIEAMACGLPVVVSDVGGLRDFVDNGVNGYRVPVGDVNALAAAVGVLAGDPERRAHMGRAARRTAERFDVAVVLRRVSNIVDEVVGRSTADR